MPKLTKKANRYRRIGGRKYGLTLIKAKLRFSKAECTDCQTDT